MLIFYHDDTLVVNAVLMARARTVPIVGRSFHNHLTKSGPKIGLALIIFTCGEGQGPPRGIEICAPTSVRLSSI